MSQGPLARNPDESSASENELRIVLVGGSGHWAARENHIPAILQMEPVGLTARVAAIVDPRDPYLIAKSDGFESLRELLSRDNPTWLDPTRYEGSISDMMTHAFGANEGARAVIVSCPPVHHADYIEWSVDNDVNVLCDKPMLVTPFAAVSEDSVNLLARRYKSIRQKLLFKRAQGEPILVACPLRRRANDVYQKVATDITDIYTGSGQGVTLLNLAVYSGLYRFPTEYEMGDAHGYAHGVGTLSFSGYHFVDLLSWYLQLAPGHVESVELGLSYLRRVKDIHESPQGKLLGALITKGKIPSRSVPDMVALAESDYAFTIKLLDQHDRTVGVMTFSYMANSYSHRIEPEDLGSQRADAPAFREYGRMSQFVLDVGQGNISHIQLSKNDVVGSPYSIDYMRRTSPLVSQEPYIQRRYDHAHKASALTPRDLTNEFLQCTVDGSLPHSSSLLSDFISQDFTMRMFIAMYRLIARDAEGQKGPVVLLLSPKHEVEPGTVLIEPASGRS